MNKEEPILVMASGKPRCIGRTCGPNIREEGRAIRYMSAQCKRACEAGSNLCGKCIEYQAKGPTTKQWHGRYGMIGNLPAYSHIRGSEWNLTTRAKEDAKAAAASAKVAAAGTEAEAKAADVAETEAAAAAKATEKAEAAAAKATAKAEAAAAKARRKTERIEKAAKKEELDLLSAAGKFFRIAEKEAAAAASARLKAQKQEAATLRRQTAKNSKKTTTRKKTARKSSNHKGSNHKKSSSRKSSNHKGTNHKKSSSNRKTHKKSSNHIYTAVSNAIKPAGGAGAKVNSLNRNIANSLAEFGFDVEGLRMPSSSSASRMSTPNLD